MTLTPASPPAPAAPNAASAASPATARRDSSIQPSHASPYIGPVGYIPAERLPDRAPSKYALVPTGPYSDRRTAMAEQ